MKLVRNIFPSKLMLPVTSYLCLVYLPASSVCLGDYLVSIPPVCLVSPSIIVTLVLSIRHHACFVWLPDFLSIRVKKKKRSII